MRLQIDRRFEETAFGIAKAVIGVALALTPWVLGFTAALAAALNGWIVGAAIALLAVATLFWANRWAPSAHLALGVWAIVAPFLLGFSAMTAAFAAHMIAGIPVAAIAALELWFIHNRPMKTA